MDLLRNIITATWCAIVIGTNVFGLMLLARLLGPDMLQAPGVFLPVIKMGLLAGLGLLALVSTKFLWAIVAVATLALLLGVLVICTFAMIYSNALAVRRVLR